MNISGMTAHLWIEDLSYKYMLGKVDQKSGGELAGNPPGWDTFMTNLPGLIFREVVNKAANSKGRNWNRSKFRAEENFVAWMEDLVPNLFQT